jgi:chromosome segregation ATPase
MIVAFVRNTTDYRGTTEALDAELKVAEQNRTSLRDAIMESNRELSRWKDVANSRQTALENAAKAAAANEKAANERLNTAERSLGKLTEELGTLAGSLKTAQNERDAIKANLEKAVAEVTRLNDDALALAKQKYDYQRQLSDRDAKVRAYEEQIVEMQKQLNFLTQAAANAKIKVPEYVETPPTSLNGLVKAVDNEKRIIEISLGSSDGVTKDLTFIVSRGNTYLADAVITAIEEHSAVAQLKTVQGEIREGDNVTYEFRK